VRRVLRKDLTENGLCARYAFEHLHENTMKNEDKKTLMQSFRASTIGFEVAFSPFIGIFIGLVLDSWLGTSPYLAVIFLILGVVAGFNNYYRFIKRQQEEDKRGSEKR
jgi:ATP synthase protein I